MARSANADCDIADEITLSLRALKNRLQARFPTVKSSHLSEAIAAGLGHNTHAALRAAQLGPDNWRLNYSALDASFFQRRLLELGYPVQPDFRLGAPPVGPIPPAHYVEWLRQIRELEEGPARNGSLARSLQNRCAQEFARVFEIGHQQIEDDKDVSIRWRGSIDHGACLPNWGSVFGSHDGGYVRFPGSDHPRHFFESLPLAGGKRAEYQRAMVSMPYVDATGIPMKLDAAANIAGRIGWTCSQHNEWSWYAPGKTALVLFKRSTPHDIELNAWERSFKRWLLENRTALNKSAGTRRRQTIADIIDCKHVPFDLRDFDDCRERYLKEFVPHLLRDRGKGRAGIFERLMETWSAA